MAIDTDPVRVVHDLVAEACVGETLGAAEALAALQRALRSFRRYLAEVETVATWDRVVARRVTDIEAQVAELERADTSARGAGTGRAGRGARAGARP